MDLGTVKVPSLPLRMIDWEGGWPHFFSVLLPFLGGFLYVVSIRLMHKDHFLRIFFFKGRYMGHSSRTARAEALLRASSRGVRSFERPEGKTGQPLKTSEYFGCWTFSFDTMEEKLSTKEFKQLKEYATTNDPLSIQLADKVASEVKDWALSHGATHFCHWFQPQTGATAEKHDAFIAMNRKGALIEKFTGKALIQSEPDASSFPSGGRRSTFEARGYTVWDASSPMFLMKTESGMTLCIPSLFVSYSGEALDKKAPLLRSMAAVSKKSVEALKLLGSNDTTHVNVMAGPEQEYFVIDEAFYALRPDLIFARRTLIGNPPPRGQQLEDHYFGSIKPRILNFMMECEHELYRLGVPCKTRHNEVAPCQYEMAPLYENANVSADHNQLIMEVLRSIAKRHQLVVLFHEKPFAGMNGSGKHVNWSLQDNRGDNLLEPGEDPAVNLRFLYFLTATIKAIHDNGTLLRMAVASPGNDFRLGANEAPPAIMSIFLGETLTEILNRLETEKGKFTEKQKEIHLELGNIPVLRRDNTDRNRTSPFAFTGNKFEFRAVGASASISPPLTYLNAAVAAALDEMNDRLRKKAGSSKPTEDQVFSLIQEVIRETENIRFEGNNYGEEWHQIAEKRGLPNIKTAPQALQVLKEESKKRFLFNLGVATKEESEARYNVRMERYNKIRLIELETLYEMVATQVLPAAFAQQTSLSQSVGEVKSVLSKIPESQVKHLSALTSAIGKLVSLSNELKEFIQNSKELEDDEKLAMRLAEDGMYLMERCRKVADELELQVEDSLWPLPKYREMLTLG